MRSCGVAGRLSSTARFTTTASCAPNSNRSASASQRIRTPRCCSSVTLLGRRMCSIACAACSRSPFTMPNRASCSARGTSSASSRSTTPSKVVSLSSPPRSSRFSSILHTTACSTSRRSPNTCASSSQLWTRRFSRAYSSSLRRISCASVLGVKCTSSDIGNPSMCTMKIARLPRRSMLSNVRYASRCATTTLPTSRSGRSCRAASTRVIWQRVWRARTLRSRRSLWGFPNTVKRCPPHHGRGVLGSVPDRPMAYGRAVGRPFRRGAVLRR